MKKIVSALPYPRTIDPALIQIGDTIQVSMPKERGLEIRYVGTVHHRSDHGSTRYLYTEEGATILAWEVKRRIKQPHVLLIHRPDAVNEPLSFFDNEEIKDRLAG